MIPMTSDMIEEKHKLESVGKKHFNARYFEIPITYKVHSYWKSIGFLVKLGEQSKKNKRKIKSKHKRKGQ